MIARRSLCLEKLGSNPGQGSKGINFSGWHGLDMSVTVTKRDNTAWVLGIFHGPLTTLVKHRLAPCSSLEIVAFAPWLCVLNIILIISLFVFPVHIIYNAKIIIENKKDMRLTY